MDSVYWIIEFASFYKSCKLINPFSETIDASRLIDRKTKDIFDTLYSALLSKPLYPYYLTLGANHHDKLINGSRYKIHFRCSFLQHLFVLTTIKCS